MSDWIYESFEDASWAQLDFDANEPGDYLLEWRIYYTNAKNIPTLTSKLQVEIHGEGFKTEKVDVYQLKDEGGSIQGSTTLTFPFKGQGAVKCLVKNYNLYGIEYPTLESWNIELYIKAKRITKAEKVIRDITEGAQATLKLLFIIGLILGLGWFGLKAWNKWR